MSQYFDNKARNRYKDYPVNEECELLQFLMSHIDGISRTRAKELLSRKMVYVNSQITTRYNTPLHPGMLVQISDHGHKRDLQSQWLRIVYEDAFLLVVDKANGILTNSTPGKRTQSVKTILDEYVKRTNRTFAVHTVHRLDRETSGLLIFAKRRDVQQMLVDRWRDLVADRRYIAVCEGQLEKEAGHVTSWLTDNKMFVTQSSPVDNGGKEATTHYRVLKLAADYNLVEMKLDTGRKNQIRVHMQDLGHSIAGDYKYGAQTDPIGRVCLHAYKLAFQHPVTGEFLKFETPIPEQFKKLVQTKR